MTRRVEASERTREAREEERWSRKLWMEVLISFMSRSVWRWITPKWFCFVWSDARGLEWRGSVGELGEQGGWLIHFVNGLFRTNAWYDAVGRGRSLGGDDVRWYALDWCKTGRVVVRIGKILGAWQDPDMGELVIVGGCCESQFIPRLGKAQLPYSVVYSHYCVAFHHSPPPTHYPRHPSAHTHTHALHYADNAVNGINEREKNGKKRGVSEQIQQIQPIISQ